MTLRNRSENNSNLYSSSISSSRHLSQQQQQHHMNNGFHDASDFDLDNTTTSTSIATKPLNSSDIVPRSSSSTDFSASSQIFTMPANNNAVLSGGSPHNNSHHHTRHHLRQLSSQFNNFHQNHGRTNEEVDDNYSNDFNGNNINGNHNNNNLYGALNGSSGNSNALSVSEVTCKDSFRHVFLNLPLGFFHVLSLLVTFFLIFIALAERSTTQKTWYLLLEGIMVFFFAFEITSRYILSRSVFGSYFKNRANLIEALVCGVCVIMFLFLLFSRGGGIGRRGGSSSSNLPKLSSNIPDEKAQLDREDTEHELVVIVRFVAQMFRGYLYLRATLRKRREMTANGGDGGDRIMIMHHHHHHVRSGSNSSAASSVA